MPNPFHLVRDVNIQQPELPPPPSYDEATVVILPSIPTHIKAPTEILSSSMSTVVQAGTMVHVDQTPLGYSKSMFQAEGMVEREHTRALLQKDAEISGRDTPLPPYQSATVNTTDRHRHVEGMTMWNRDAPMHQLGRATPTPSSGRETAIPPSTTHRPSSESPLVQPTKRPGTPSPSEHQPHRPHLQTADSIREIPSGSARLIYEKKPSKHASGSTSSSNSRSSHSNTGSASRPLNPPKSTFEAYRVSARERPPPPTRVGNGQGGLDPTMMSSHEGVDWVALTVLTGLATVWS